MKHSGSESGTNREKLGIFRDWNALRVANDVNEGREENEIKMHVHAQIRYPEMKRGFQENQQQHESNQRKRTFHLFVS